MTEKLAQAYRDGLQLLLRSGNHVPSVLGAKSKASNFGLGDRPWLELIGHQFTLENSRPLLISSSVLPVHLGYVFGLLAWTLDGRNDLASLSYYRPAAKDYSDDGIVLCGAFGVRLFGLHNKGGQVQAIRARLAEDPSSRRTYAAIVEANDNIAESREYPCAAGIQLFLRNGTLHWLTIMRAQQALTILPYDVFLFSCLHHFTASSLGVTVGSYTHFSGTFHIYENECSRAQQVIESDIRSWDLPTIPPGWNGSSLNEPVNIS